MTKLKMWNDLTIISKPHAQPHTMEKTHAKYHNDWYKTVRGEVLTVHILRVKNDQVHNMEKMTKNDLIFYIQTACKSSYHEENTCKVSKQSEQNCKRSCAHI